MDIFMKGKDEYCYYAASTLVGLTMAVGIYALFNAACIVFFWNSHLYKTLSLAMDIFCLIMSVASFLYYRSNGRWHTVYKEILHSSISKKQCYGVFCLIYLLLTYGLWFLTNDIIRALNTGQIPRYPFCSFMVYSRC